MQKRLTQFVMCFALIGAGCNDVSFQGKSGSPKKGASKSNEHADAVPQATPSQTEELIEARLKIPCRDGIAQTTKTISGSDRKSLIVEGEFCDIDVETTSGSLSSFFVLDFSGSMQTNDPVVGGSCGRLEAALAIVDKLETAIGDAELSVGFLQFDDTVVGSVEPEKLDSFKERLTAENFCGNTSGSTNYEAALLATADILKKTKGQKVVYFISDGLPTKSVKTVINPFKSATEIYNAGVEAAEKLRNEDSDLVLNAIYLGATSTGGTVDPEEYLQRITGSKDNVKLAENAESLTDEILQFETPEVSTLSKSSLTANLSAEGFATVKVKVNSLKKDPSREGFWLFTTDPVPLLSDDTKDVENTIKISVLGSDGASHEATATITIEAKE